MDFRAALTPVLMMGLSGALLAGVAFGHAGPAARTRSYLWAWAALLVLVILGTLLEHGLPPHLLRPAGQKAAGALGVVVSASLLLWGVHLRRRSELLRGARPQSVDEAIRVLGPRGRRLGVFEGRLGALQPVTSPGGVVGAFYDAELREVSADGHKGPLISVEKGYPQAVLLRGQRVEAEVAFSPELLVSPVVIRRCLLGGRLPGVAEEVSDAGLPPREALSYERVGKLGDRCLVVGTLTCADRPGAFRLTGPGGAPALVAIATEAGAAGRALADRAWRVLGGAAACAAVAVALLAHAT